MSSELFTIGHSNQELEAFIGLLELHGVEAIVDIRSHPRSTWATQFNREPLRERLRQSKLRYAFMGGPLGVRSPDPSHYRDGRISYQKLAESDAFQAALEQVIRAAARQRIALMCAEQDPLACHRSVLIAPLLERAGVAVRHILRSGKLESQEQLVERLLREEQLAQPDLFASKASRIANAWAKRERAIAWKEELGERADADAGEALAR